MVIPVFMNGSTPEVYFGGVAFEFDVPLWRTKYQAEVTLALDAEGLGRELVEARTTFVSTDRYLLELRTRWPDGRCASVRESLLIARYVDRGSYWAIDSIGGVPLSQS